MRWRRSELPLNQRMIERDANCEREMERRALVDRSVAADMMGRIGGINKTLGLYTRRT
jgi:hypothetical protein